MRNHDRRAFDDAFSSLDGGAGIPGKRTRSEGLAGGFGGGAPILQFKPAGGGGDVSAGESFVDDLLGHGAEAKGEGKGGADDKKPGWMNPDSSEPLPGEPVPGFGPGHKYTAADKDKLEAAYEARFKANKTAVATFLREYVDAAVTIVAKYIKGSVKEKDEMGSFLKFVVAESLASLAGGVGMKIAKEGMEFLAGKVADYVSSAAMEDDEVFDDEKNLDKLIDSLGATTGALAAEMVAMMESGFKPGRWLGEARPEQLHRFRIPERFTSPPRAHIRGIVAGTVGGAHHRRVIGRNAFDGVKWLKVDDVDPTDHNVIVVHVGVSSMGTGTVKSARINSRNQELPKEINDKIAIGSLSAMALHVTIDPSEDRLNPSARIMKAMMRGEATPDDVLAFEAAYPKNGSKFTYTRNTKGAFATEGEGTMADQLLMYQLATGDHDLSTLADRFNGSEEDPDRKVTRPGNQSPQALARSAYMAFKSTESAVTGAHALTTAVVDKAKPHG